MIPNFISCLRILMAPVVFFSIQKKSSLLTCFVILGAVFSDILDGFLAKKWQRTSLFGAFLDVGADKIFVYTALLAYYLNFSNKILIAVSLEWIFRDSGLFFVYFLKKQPNFESLILGKLHTGLQFGYLMFLGCIKPSFIWHCLFFISFAFTSFSSALQYYKQWNTN